MAIELLTAREFTTKYPVSESIEGNYETWLRLLEKWRSTGKLEEGRHWKYKSVGNCQPARAYMESKVLRLCVQTWKSDQRCAPFYSLLMEKHGIVIAAVIRAASAPLLPNTPDTPNKV